MLNKEEIEQLYLVEGLTLREIAGRLSISYSTFNYQFKKLNIPIREWDIGKSSKGSIKTPEQREAIRQAALERYRDKTKHPMAGKTHSNEAKAKMSAAGRGINKRAHLPEWDGTRSKESNKFYTSAAWLELSKMVLERDNYTCALTGQKGGNLEVHHIVHRAEDETTWYDPDNLITLSRASHQNLHATEKRLGKSVLTQKALSAIAILRTSEFS
jgi:hypothetical protein